MIAWCVCDVSSNNTWCFGEEQWQISEWTESIFIVDSWIRSTQTRLKERERRDLLGHCIWFRLAANLCIIADDWSIDFQLLLKQHGVDSASSLIRRYCLIKVSTIYFVKILETSRDQKVCMTRHRYRSTCAAGLKLAFYDAWGMKLRSYVCPHM